jgi:hypothetical protein
MRNKARPEHVAEALDDVRDAMPRYVTEEYLDVDEMLSDVKDLLKAERLGDAEMAYSLARRVAGLAVLYMAMALPHSRFTRRGT